MSSHLVSGHGFERLVQFATDAPESKQGFLLNHVISELLPPREDGYRYANADPVTGQAAWYDLRVRVERAPPAEAGLGAPQFTPLRPPAGLPARPATSRYGLEFRPRR